MYIIVEYKKMTFRFYKEFHLYASAFYLNTCFMWWKTISDSFFSVGCLKFLEKSLIVESHVTLIFETQIKVLCELSVLR